MTHSVIASNVWISPHQANEHPKISVLIPVHQAEKLIHGLLEDLCAQTCLAELELIVIDNASSPAEMKVILEYAKRYNNLHIFRHEQFVPLGFALQHAAEFARGEYISVALPEYRHLANHYEALYNQLDKNTEIIYADLAVTDFKTQKYNRTYETASLLGYVRYLSHYNVTNIAEMFDVPPQFLIKKSFLMKTGGFLPELDELSLYGNWINWISQQAQTKHINDVLGLYLFINKKKYQAIEERHYLSLLYPEVPLARLEHELEKDQDGQPTQKTNRFVFDMSEMYFVTPPKGKWHPIEACPLVSVLFILDAAISYDARYEPLQLALAQLLRQNYPHWECVIVQCDPNQPSVSSFVYEINAKNQYPLQVFEAEYEVMSVSVAKNIALRLARGTLMVHLTGAVVLPEDYLSTCVEQMKKQNIGIGFFPYTVNQQDYVPVTDVNELFKEPSQPIETWVYRRECLQYYGLFDETLRYYDHWEWLLKLSKTITFHCIEAPPLLLTETEKDRIYRLVGKDPEKIDACINEFQGLTARYPKDDPIKVRVEREQYVRRLVLHKPDDMYQTWSQRRGLREIHAQILAERMVNQWTVEPVLHFVFLVNTSAELTLLEYSLESIKCQLYKKYAVTVLSHLVTPDLPILLEIPDLQWVELYPNDHLPELLTRVAELVPSDWLALLEPGIRFEPHTCITVGNYINAYPDWQVIYTDEDTIDAETKEQTDPQFKPDFNLDYLRSMAYLGRFVLFNTALVRETTNAFRYLDVFNYDMTLQVLDQKGEKAIGHIADILVHLPRESQRQFDEKRGMFALEDHLKRNQIAARVDVGFAENTYFIEYLHDTQPLVSIIIPNKNKLSYLEPCITSLFEKTAEYTNYEVIVIDNQSDEPEVFAFYQECEATYGQKIRIISYDYPFNFAAICNFGVKHAKGEYVLLLNNDTQFLQKSWLNRMMMHAQRPEVGIVGAKLLYPELGYVQHGGVILGMLGTADHACHVGQTIMDPLYMNRGIVVQNFSSVTAACMVVRKSVYEQVNGMDEEHFAVLFNDSDFCIRVGQAGYKVTYTPFAMVVHHESISRKKTEEDSEKAAMILARDERERSYFMKKWLPLLANDPAYNPHLSLQMSFRTEPFAVLNWDTHLVDRPRIVGVPLSGGCGQYRVVSPFERLGVAGLAECEYLSTSKGIRAIMPVELMRLSPDSFMVHAALDPVQQHALKYFKEFVPDVFRLFALDDLVSAVPEKSAAYRGFKRAFGEATSLLRKSLSYCDRMIVSTEPIKQLAEGMIEDIRVIPNCLERDRWVGLETKRRIGKKPRVGWAGAQQHQGDLEIIVEVVKATAHEVDWIFMGMTIPELKPYVKEEYRFVPYAEYPKKLASLNLDLAIAPLEINEFNEAKSNLRLLEYGVMGWPIICTDIYPYQQANAPVKRVPNQARAWIDAIRERIYDLDAAEKEGARVQKWVLDHFIIEDHLAEWLEAMLSPAKWNAWKYKLNLVTPPPQRRTTSKANPGMLLANILGNIKK